MRILILEDDTELADQIAAMLRDENFAVDVIHDGQEGLEYGLENTYDGVILDPGLPTMDGFSVLKRWRDKGLAMPVIVLNQMFPLESRAMFITWSSGRPSSLVK